MQKKKERAVEFGFCCKKVSKHKKEGLDIRKTSKPDVLCKIQKNQNVNVIFYFKSITVHAIELCQS